MKNRLCLLTFTLLAGLSGMPGIAGSAETLESLSQQYATQAKQASPQFTGFSAERGKTLYFQQETRNGKQVSCATCHTSDPKEPGQTLAFRPVEPLAPMVNPARFTDVKKVEKWFRRNCNDVFARECTAVEKGDFLAYIATVR